jgi:hypothetical protein
MKLEEIKANYKRWDLQFPENGEEVESIMRMIIDRQGLKNISGKGPAYSLSAEQYSVTREIAIHYGHDVSQLPEKLNENEKGNLGVVILK